MQIKNNLFSWNGYKPTSYPTGLQGHNLLILDQDLYYQNPTVTVWGKTTFNYDDYRIDKTTRMRLSETL